MKNKLVLLIGGALSILFFHSCKKTDGALYSGPSDKISFFSTTTGVTMKDGELNIPVGRTSSNGDLSVPVVLSAVGAGYTNVFKLAGPVSFASGESKAYAKVNYSDISGIDPSSLSLTTTATDINVGLAFPFSLTIGDADVSPTNKKKIDVSASNILEFDAPVSTTMNSAWIRNSVEGSNGMISVQIQKAKGARVYKVVKPYGFRNFAFMIKSDGTTVVCPNQIVANDPDYGNVTMASVTGKIANGVVTLNAAGFTVAAGSFGAHQEIITIPAQLLN